MRRRGLFALMPGVSGQRRREPAGRRRPQDISAERGYGGRRHPESGADQHHSRRRISCSHSEQDRRRAVFGAGSANSDRQAHGVEQAGLQWHPDVESYTDRRREDHGQAEIPDRPGGPVRVRGKLLRKRSFPPGFRLPMETNPHTEGFRHPGGCQERNILAPTHAEQR